MNRFPLLLLSLLAPLGLAAAAFAQEEPAYPTRFRVTGLFSPDREADFRAALAELPELKLEALEYERAEAVFAYDPKTAFPGAKPEQIRERLDQKIRGVSKSTFGIHPLLERPREELEAIEIPVAGLDCKGCAFGAYKAVIEIEGVEQATASFKLGLIRAWIDPARTNRPALEDALRRRQVEVLSGETPAP